VATLAEAGPFAADPQHLVQDIRRHHATEDAHDMLTLGAGLPPLTLETRQNRPVLQRNDVADRLAGLIVERREPMFEVDVAPSTTLADHLNALNGGPGLRALAAKRRTECEHEAWRQIVRREASQAADAGAPLLARERYAGRAGRLDVQVDRSSC
jgi:hypothetical protein